MVKSVRETEKRKNQRSSFRDALELKFSATHPATGSPEHMARGIDISSGGVGLEARDELRKGEVVKLFVPFRRGGANLPVFAEVCWVSMANETYRMGLRFLA